MDEKEQTAISLKLPQELFEQVRQLAEKEERSLSGQVRKMLSDALAPVDTDTRRKAA